MILVFGIRNLEYVEIQLRESREQDVTDVYMMSCDTIGLYYKKLVCLITSNKYF
jgi:hypothetical protein